MGLLTCCDVVKCVRRTNDTTVRLCPLECRTKMPSRFTSLRVSIILYYDDVCWRVGSIRRKRRTTSRSFYSTQRTSNERNMTLFAVIAKTNHTKLPPQQQTNNNKYFTVHRGKSFCAKGVIPCQYCKNNNLSLVWQQHTIISLSVVVFTWEFNHHDCHHVNERTVHVSRALHGYLDYRRY